MSADDKELRNSMQGFTSISLNLGPRCRHCNNFADVHTIYHYCHNFEPVPDEVSRDIDSLSDEDVKQPEISLGKPEWGNVVHALEILGITDFCLGNSVKHMARGDLQQAQWYLNRRIEQLKSGES